MKKELIVKHNSMIEGRYKMSVTEIKIIAYLTSLIKKEDEDFEVYRFHAKELLEKLNTDNNYDDLKTAISKLITRMITIKTKESVLVTTFLSSAEYFYDSTIELSFDKKLKPYLLQLKGNFTKYYLENVLNLKSFYAIRIYELLKQYENIGDRRFELEELKEILGIKNKYKLYGHFKDKVLQIAKREINAKTDLEMDFEEIKRSRKVIAIKFLITKKNIAAKRTKETEEETRIIDNFLQQNTHLDIKNPGAYRKKLLRVLREKGYLNINEFEERLQQEKEEVAKKQEELLKEAGISLKGLFKKI